MKKMWGKVAGKRKTPGAVAGGVLALQTTRRCALERLRSAISWLLTLLIWECRDRNLQQAATPRALPLQPLQSLKPLQPSKSNLDANPPQRGHSPTGPATYVAVCSGPTQLAISCLLNLPILECRDRTLHGQSKHEPGRFHRYKYRNCFNRQNRTSTPIPRIGDTPREAPQLTWRRALERLRSAISCLLNVPILECRNRNLQQTATARTWPLPSLQRLKPLQPSKSNLDANPPPRGHSPTGPATYVAVCSGAAQECHFLPAQLAEFGMQRSDSAADSHSTNLVTSAATNTETASTIKIEPRPKSPAAGTLPDGPCKLCGGVLWSDSRVPFPACLPCRFWNAEIGLCSGRPQHEARRFHRYKS